MDDYLRNFAVAFPVMLALDFAWFGVLLKQTYLDELGALARTRDGRFTPVLPAGLIAWVAIAAGVVLLAVPRLTPDSSVVEVLGRGALFGVIAYTIYDMTNLATLQGYSLKLALIDIAWGTTLCAVITLIVWLVAR